MTKQITLLALTLLLTFSCSTTNPRAHRTSSKIVYSLMIKDPVGIESYFSKELKDQLSGDMVIKALAAVQKNKGKLEGIEYIKTAGNDTWYDIHLKQGKVPLKLTFNKKNQIEKLWIDNTPLVKEL